MSKFDDSCFIASLRFQSFVYNCLKKYICTVEELNHWPVFHITVVGINVPLIYFYFSNNKNPPAFSYQHNELIDD